MAKLTESDILHVARLAKLTLSKKEIGVYLKQLVKVVAFIGELGKIDTSGLEATSQTTGLENVYRVDELRPEEVLPREDAIGGTDQVHNGYFKAKAVLPKKR